MTALKDLPIQERMSESERKRLGEARDRRFEIEASLEPFFADGLIVEVVGIIRQGKEANVYCCRGSRWSGHEYVAAKVYRALNQRGLRHDAEYQQGRDRGLRGTDKRALANKSRQGRFVQSVVWVRSEFDTLKLLHAAGADVPQPISCADSALLMELIGHGTDAAPVLARVAMAPEDSRKCLRQIIQNIALWLRCDRVHGDLSAYNILYHDGRTVAIDFPQAVDPRFNHNARRLFERDLENICSHFVRSGLNLDSRQIAHEVWRHQRLSEV